MDRVDGGGLCSNHPEGTTSHEWRCATIRQQNAPPPQLAGARPDAPRIFIVFYCIHCLEIRDVEVDGPIVAPVVVQNLLVAAGQAGLAH